jgi:hypothetical protein
MAVLAAWGVLPPLLSLSKPYERQKKASDSSFDEELKKNAIAALYSKVYNDLGGRKVCNIKDHQRGCATPSLYL